MCLTAAAHAGLSFSGRGLAMVSAQADMIGRSWPRFAAADLY